MQASAAERPSPRAWLRQQQQREPRRRRWSLDRGLTTACPDRSVKSKRGAVQSSDALQTGSHALAFAWQRLLALEERRPGTPRQATGARHRRPWRKPSSASKPCSRRRDAARALQKGARPGLWALPGCSQERSHQQARRPVWPLSPAPKAAPPPAGLSAPKTSARRVGRTAGAAYRASWRSSGTSRSGLHHRAKG